MTLNPRKKHARHAVSKAKVSFSESEPEPVVTEPTTEYECEACGTKARLTEKDAFDAGWDYPPFIGTWGVVSPRTCPNCLIDKTAWWHLITHGGDNVPENHVRTIKRIMAERLPLT